MEAKTPGQRIAYRIDYWRRVRGLTMTELFEKSGNDKPTFYKLWRGIVKEPRLSTVEAYARTLNVPVDYLLYGHPDTDPDLAANNGNAGGTTYTAPAPSLADVLQQLIALEQRPHELRVVRDVADRLLAASLRGKAEGPSPAHAPAAEEAGVTAA